MKSAPSEAFFREKCLDIFSSATSVIDIGEGLRARTSAGNRYDPARAWLQPHIERVDYKVMDPVPDYSPDIVGDIHAMPFAEDTVEAIICLAVLEHVENPILAMQEIHRTLKPGGKALLYVPFLYYFHAEEGYYGDYWRFTSDTVRLLTKPFSEVEVMHVRDRIEMLVHLTPLGRFAFVTTLARRLDTWIDKTPKQQVGGFYIYVTK